MTPISQIDKHLKKEFEDWEKIQQKELGKLISAKRHLYVNIGAYLLISVIEGILSSISGSQTLKADAFNNLSGIISTVLLIIGIHIASDIDDDDIAGIPKFRCEKQATISVFNLRVGVTKRFSRSLPASS